MKLVRGTGRDTNQQKCSYFYHNQEQALRDISRRCQEAEACVERCHELMDLGLSPPTNQGIEGGWDGKDAVKYEGDYNA
jgi:hypothetical protein